MCQPTIRHELNDHDIIEQLMHSAATLVDETEVVLATRVLDPSVANALRKVTDAAVDARSEALYALQKLPQRDEEALSEQHTH